MRGIFFIFLSLVLLNFAAPNFGFAQQNNDVTTLDTQAVIRDQLTAFQTRDHERAFSHAAPGIKNIFKNTENFIGMVRRGCVAADKYDQSIAFCISVRSI